MSELLGRAHEIKTAKDQEAAERQRQALRQAEEQRTQETKEALMQQESDQRAQEFITIMQAHDIPTIALYAGVWWWRTHELTKKVKIGKGWITSSPYAEVGDGGSSLMPGTILSPNGMTYEWHRTIIEKGPFRKTYLAETISPPDYLPSVSSYLEVGKKVGVPVKSPYCGDYGLQKLGNALVRYGVIE